MDLARVQYRLGSGGLLYAMVLALVASAAFYSHSNLLFAAVGLMVGGLVFAVLWAWRSLRRLRVQRSTPHQVSAGDTLTLRYRVDNHGRLPAFAVVLREHLAPPAEMTDSPAQLGGAPVTWALHVGRRRGIRMQSRCRPLRRGVLALHGISVSSTFPFGIIRKTLSFERPGAVLVLPRLYRLDPELVGRLVRGAQGDEGPGRGVGGGDEFYGLRPYRSGDRPRAIDWKRSARGGGLVVRERTRHHPPHLSVRLELAPCGDDPGESFMLEERAISLAGSLLSDAHRAGLRVDLHIENHRVAAPAAPGHAKQLAAMLETLARLPVPTPSPAHDTATASAFVPAARRSASGSHVVVWTGPSSAPPPPRGDRGGVITLLGAEDFTRHLAATARVGSKP